MKKPIIKHLRLATMVMGITLAASALADEEHNDSKSDLLCVAIEGASEHKSALAVLRVEKNDQAQGALCYLSSLDVTELADCYLVAGRVLKTPGAVKASYVGLIGTGLDEHDRLTQNDVAIRFDPDKTLGKGSAAEYAVTDRDIPVRNDTGVGEAFQSPCAIYTNTQEVTIARLADAPVTLRKKYAAQRIAGFGFPESKNQSGCSGVPSGTQGCP